MNKHPLSAAIVREAKKENVEIQPVADFTALPGEGVTGRIGTGRASLLNLAALDKRGLSSDEVADAFNRASEKRHVERSARGYIRRTGSLCHG